MGKWAYAEDGWVGNHVWGGVDGWGESSHLDSNNSTVSSICVT